MNPEYRGSGYYYDKSISFVKQEKLKKSQMYKKKNQNHPAFKRGR